MKEKTYKIELTEMERSLVCLSIGITMGTFHKPSDKDEWSEKSLMNRLHKIAVKCGVNER